MELDQREARNPVEEGVSLLPYVPLFQRVHLTRWRQAAGWVAVAATALGALLWWRRR